ncbi:hypothetical protein [Paenibacillus sp. GCM10023250]|uniref:hypothetical protein n=1 Tax=Paenibacillus sp. GCM10023250 TaxID=3252648 RepID=UPI003612CCB7
MRYLVPLFAPTAGRRPTGRLLDAQGANCLVASRAFLPPPGGRASLLPRESMLARGPETA